MFKYNTTSQKSNMTVPSSMPDPLDLEAFAGQAHARAPLTQAPHSFPGLPEPHPLGGWPLPLGSHTMLGAYGQPDSMRPWQQEGYYGAGGGATQQPGLFSWHPELRAQRGGDVIEAERQRLTSMREERARQPPAVATGAAAAPAAAGSAEDEAAQLVESLALAVSGGGADPSGAAGDGVKRYDTSRSKAARERAELMTSIRRAYEDVRVHPNPGVEYAKQLRAVSRDLKLQRQTMQYLAGTASLQDAASRAATPAAAAAQHRAHQLTMHSPQHQYPPARQHQASAAPPGPRDFLQSPQLYSPAQTMHTQQRQQQQHAAQPHAPQVAPASARRRQPQIASPAAFPRHVQPPAPQQQGGPTPASPRGGGGFGSGVAMMERPPPLQRTASGGYGQAPRGGGSSEEDKQQLRGDSERRSMILSEILDASPAVSWGDIAALTTAKQALVEAVVLPTMRPEIFSGLRAPVRGILLYGPPGNGKTMLGKALASETRATFFNISAASLTSRWMGEGEKLVRELFRMAKERQPSIIFIDEIDSILTMRSIAEHDAMRRLKTEFLLQFDGIASSGGGGSLLAGGDRVVVVGATNRPHELDHAALRRFTKRIYVPLPDASARYTILAHLLHSNGQPAALSQQDVDFVVLSTEGFSASDLAALCKEAAMAPVREVGAAIATVHPGAIRPLDVRDFQLALSVTKPSVNMRMMQLYEEFTQSFGVM